MDKKSLSFFKTRYGYSFDYILIDEVQSIDLSKFKQHTMYLKVKQNSDLHKRLLPLHEEEERVEAENREAIRQHIPYNWSVRYGFDVYTGSNRLYEYEGFAFTDYDENDKSWKAIKHDDYTIYIPNRRTKKGREHYEFLNNLKALPISALSEVLGYDPWDGHKGRSTISFPRMWYRQETFFICLGDYADIDMSEVVLLTRKQMVLEMNGEKEGED